MTLNLQLSCIYKMSVHLLPKNTKNVNISVCINLEPVWDRSTLPWLLNLKKYNKMKKFIIAAILVSMVAFYLSACKKSDKQQTTLEKIQGVWQLDTDIIHEYFQGTLVDITATTGEPGDIVDFRTDG